ncbi:PorP/SprF family type IX secretion system membrane protein [Ohtaekwangia koreensis]|uniref:Type IX secretion system membrane protein, PorP/SprF family n=1 Tax=Ohtaekwangia koreensis TaxID=688867 RepID=A0A1T5M6H8_9BACT|nr:PorP/SprF family type IX secretion system membrane protein [Ohtaekwangia koreensis]SKC83826.1 type IX secretion system membrane protein, PorP/SprF family [Ohtaekwangia koreensis]
MKPAIKILLILIGLLPLSFLNVQAQQSLMYSHYFLNPFLYNPSFVAPNGYTEVYLNYRNQWAGIEGAPTTGTVSIHVPLNYKAGVAFTAYQDKAGVLKTTTGLITFAYQVYLGNSIKEEHKIGFGISAGMTSNSINAGDAYANDPVTGTTSSFEGQFGIHYQLKNFKLAFAIPRLFRTYVASEQDFNKVGIEQIKTTITSASYMIRFSSRVAFEPMVTYRTYENTVSQYEGLGVIHIDNIAWFGGSYRQDYGATAFIGFNIKDKVKLGYAYEFATSQINSFGDGTHEMQLVLRLGKKKNERPQSKSKAQVKQQPVESSPKEEEEEEYVIGGKEQERAAEDQEHAAEEPERIAKESEHVAKESEQQEEVAQQPRVKQSEPLPTAADGENQKDQTVKSLSGNKLVPGHYVVVGAFRSIENAKTYTRTLKRAGYPADIAYQPEKGYYIVHMTNAPTLQEAQLLRNKYRQMSRYSFRDTWILSVEE